MTAPADPVRPATLADIPHIHRLVRGLADYERNLAKFSSGEALVLVATDERIKNYRHPRPTTKKLRKFAEVVLCARQHGLIVALTRLVHFGPISKDLRCRHDAVHGGVRPVVSRR